MLPRQWKYVMVSVLSVMCDVRCVMCHGRSQGVWNGAEGSGHSTQRLV